MKKVLFLFLSFFVILNANAKVDNNLVVSAEKYLNSVTGLNGGFTQISNGKTQHGVFSMLRPGRIRLDYNDAPIQLISDGQDLYFFDKSLDQITTVPLTSTPAGILVRKKIDLQNADINVFDTQSDANTFTLKINLKGQEGLGHMDVVFNKNPVKLKSWSVVDATSVQTDVVFNNLKTKTDFSKEYFQLSRHKTTSTNDGDDFYD